MVLLESAGVKSSAFIKIDGQDTNIEKLHRGTGEEKIRLSSWDGEKVNSLSLILSEEELIDLLHKAIHSGALPRNFIGKLRERIEI
jgi:hypothetical protein